MIKEKKKNVDQCEKSSGKCSDIITETLINLKNHQRNVQTLSLKTRKSLERVKQWFVPSFTTLRITDFRDTHTPGKTIINHHLVALCQTISRSYIPCHFGPNCQTISNHIPSLVRVRLSDKKQTFNIPSLGRVRLSDKKQTFNIPSPGQTDSNHHQLVVGQTVRL